LPFLGLSLRLCAPWVWKRAISFIYPPNIYSCSPPRSRATSSSALLLLIFCFASPALPAAPEAPQFLLDGAPRLGESVKQFKHDFPAARCRRRLSGEVDLHSLKREWYRWVDCAAEKGVFVRRQPATQSADDQLAVAMSATFQDQKLVSLEYWFGAETMDKWLRLFVSRYGRPDRAVRHPPGDSRYASWTRGSSKLEIEQLVIYMRIDGSGALRIEKRSTTTGVRVRISVRDLELSGELREQDNPGDLVPVH